MLLSRPWELVSRDRLAGVGVPVLTIYGDSTTPFLAAGAKSVAELLPGTDLVVPPGEDHGGLMRPEALAPSLVEFFG